MKLIGTYTTRGKIEVEAGETRIILFDGRFDTAYKVTKFDIMPGTWASDAADCFAILYTESGAANNAFNPDFSDNRQIGWAASTTLVSEEIAGQQRILDPDNLIVQDLFVTMRGDNDCNYIIEMEKYDISEATGALAMVRNRAQG